MNRQVWMLTLLFLSGCAHPFDRHPPTMGADPPLTGAEGIALVNQLEEAFEVKANGNGLCNNTIPQYQEGNSRSYFKYGDKNKAAEIFKCIVYKDATPADIKKHVDAGLALTDLYCDVFFRRVSEHTNERRFTRGVVNDVGTAVSAILGLSKVSPGVTGGAGAIFGLADGSFRNYEDAFLVTADIPTLQGKVFSDQKTFKESLKSKMPDSYPAANSMIISYANICSYTGMKSIVNSALSDATKTSSTMPTATPENDINKAMLAFIKQAKDAAAASAPAPVAGPTAAATQSP